jgi:SNF2 family DNA or RNA helicase
MRDRILGRPLVELPAVHPETKFISFSKEERVLYRILENRFRENLNRHFRQGTAQRNYGIFMLQLLRLRQCASHTFLLEQVIKDTFNVEDLLKLKRECSRLSHNPQPIYEQIKQWVQPTDEGRQKGVVRGDTLSDEYVPFGRSSFGSLFNMDVFLNSLKSDTLVERTVCRICNDVPDGACITPCQHIFCRLCIENYMHHFATCNDDDNIVSILANPGKILLDPTFSY